MTSPTKFVAFAVLVALLLVTVEGDDKGCPGNPSECVQHCKAQGKDGECERRWYRWRYQSRCKCNPCKGTLVLGACVDNVGVDVRCDGNGQNCSPSFSG